VYQRPLPGQGQQIWMMNADGTDQRQLTFADQGTNQFPNWGVINAKCDDDEDDDDGDHGKKEIRDEPLPE
jgi:hypothetical protein